jgi:hypothetical protein
VTKKSGNTISDPVVEFTEEMVVVTQHEKKPVKGKTKRKTIKVIKTRLLPGGSTSESYYLNEK